LAARQGVAGGCKGRIGSGGRGRRDCKTVPMQARRVSQVGARAIRAAGDGVAVAASRAGGVGVEFQAEEIEGRSCGMEAAGGGGREGDPQKADASRCGRRAVPRGTSILGRAPRAGRASRFWVRPSMMDSLRGLASSARRRSEERPLNAPEESPRRPLSASLPFVARMRNCRAAWPWRAGGISLQLPGSLSAYAR
jgi:hypothetical protein